MATQYRASGESRRASGIISLTAMVISLLAFLACALSPGHARADDTVVSVGIMSGEDEDVWRVAAEQGKKLGLTIKPVVFNDYTQPNEALENKEIEANAFQHQPYLDNQVQQRGYHIVAVGYTAVWPIGLYSTKHKSVGDLPPGASIGVPNDPSNEGRALRLLAEQGLITLREGTGILATVADISENPRQLDIRELDAGMVGRAVPDLDGAIVNTDWALKSGLSADQRIAQEAVEGNPYRNFIAVRTADRDQPWVAKLVAAYQNEAVRAAFDKVYKGTGVVAYPH